MSDGIVITGMGVVSPLGVGLEAFWEGLLAGRSGIRPITAFDTSPYEVRVGGQVPDFAPGAGSRAARFAVAAARMALADAGLADGWPDGDPRTGLCLGTAMGELQDLEAGFEDAPDRLLTCPLAELGRAIAGDVGAEGPNYVIPTACAAGNYAIGQALDLLRDGRADRMLAGGVDVLGQMNFAGFGRLRSMAPDVPRPFSAGRAGILVSEGAAMLVLEPLEAARRRGARPYAEVLGYGLSCDAHHMTAPHPEGAGAIAAMVAALAEAGVEPARVDYVNAHGTGTEANDRIETLALKRVLGDRAYRVPVSSIKSMIGHTMGAAAALEAVATALSVHHGQVPPTAHFLGPDPACDLDYVVAGSRQVDVRVAMSTSYGFGGNNACLVLART